MITTKAKNKRRLKSLITCYAGLLLMRRIRTRSYVTKVDLLLPHLSPFQSLLLQQSDAAFLDHFGINCTAFTYLKQLMEQHEELKNRKRMKVEEILGLTLQYLNSTMRQKTLCLIYGYSPALISRGLRLGLRVLLMVIRETKYGAIEWPSHDEMKESADKISNREPSLSNIWGFMDGVKFPIMSCGNASVQNAYYNGWLSGCFVSNVILFMADGCICYANINCPGSWHDSVVAEPLYNVLLSSHTPANYRILVDSAFKHTGNYASIVTSTANKDAAAISIRQAAEWGMRILQGAFARLTIPLRFDVEFNKDLISLSLHLYNYRTRTTGINQIRTVFDLMYE